MKKMFNKIKHSMWGGIWFLKPPDDVSLDGYRIDHVIHYTDTVITIFFGIVVLALLYFIIRYRDRPNHKAVYDRGDKKKYIVITVILGFLVFLSIDAVIETMSFKDLKEAFWNFPKDEDVVRVEVMPQQYAWNIRYAGADGKFATDDDIVSPQNQMHIPVNTPVVVQMAPYDVIHSFYIPNFRIKQDATPGMITTFWFQAVKEGEYEIACAELCGNGHYRMRGILTVESKEKFQGWLNELALEAQDTGEWDDWLSDDSGSDVGIPQGWGWPWNKEM
ncbi:MAG: hypothetical protein KC618_00690 [Candidatus Omnitrophica bacterium]|nr:hypothetical protein [Candidatus Omnitrophota bacterium]